MFSTQSQFQLSQQCCRFYSRGTDEKLSLFRSAVGDCDGQSILWQNIADPVGPLNEANPFGVVKILVGANCEEFIGISKSVGVKMGNGNAAIGIELHQHKGWAVDLIWVCLQCGAKRAGEMCLPGTQITIQRNCDALVQQRGELSCKLLGLPFAVTAECEEVTGHRAGTPSPSLARDPGRCIRHPVSGGDRYSSSD